MSLVDDIKAPDSFKKPEQNSLLKLFFQFLQSKDISSVVERASTEEEGCVVELEKLVFN